MKAVITVDTYRPVLLSWMRLLLALAVVCLWALLLHVRLDEA
jgi:hypothetical protein